MSRLLAAAALVAVAILLPPAHAPAAETVGDLAVTVAPGPKDQVQHGYTEYVVLVTNQSADRPHDVTLSIPRYSYHAPQDYLQEVSRTVRVGPGATVRVALLQPYRPVLFGNGLAVSIDGRKQERYIDFAPRSSSVSPYAAARPYGGSASYGATPLQSVVLVSRGVPDDFLVAAGRAITPPAEVFPGGVGMRTAGGLTPPGPPPKGPPPTKAAPPAAKAPAVGPGAVVRGPRESSGTPPGAGARFSRLETGVANWSTAWLAYSCYDGVILTGEELGRAPGAVRTALWQFAETGGTLLVLGEAKVPEGWRLRGPQSSGYNVYDAGFGQGVVALDAGYARWPAARWNELRTAWAGTGVPWGKVRTVAEANNDFPVVDDVGVPVRGLFALMLVFVILIGPVNMIVLARKKRRLWLLWTVPLISLITCLLVIGYMLAAEGWHGHRRAMSLTLLDGHSHRATTIGWAGFYTPLTPGDGLHFGNDTEVAPQNAVEYRHGRPNASGHTLAWGADQHLARGWVQPRVPAHFMLRKSEVRRERVTVARGPDGGLTLVNGLGAHVRRFWYADEDGRLHTAQEVAPGARAALAPGDVKVQADGAAGPARAYRGDWLVTLGNVVKHPEHHLVPGSYLAELDEAPFVEEGLPGARAERCGSLVLGTLKGTGDEN
jgi:hypothetical protein